MKDIVNRLTNLRNYKTKLKFPNHFINSPVALLILLAQEHHHLEPPVLGVDLTQDPLQQHLQKGFLAQEAVLLAI